MDMQITGYPMHVDPITKVIDKIEVITEPKFRNIMGSTVLKNLWFIRRLFVPLWQLHPSLLQKE